MLSKTKSPTLFLKFPNALLQLGENIRLASKGECLLKHYWLKELGLAV